MEKRKPTYDLDAVKAAIGSVETLAITRTAFTDALSLGFNRPGIVAAIPGIKRTMFIKSMTRMPITGFGRMFIMCQRKASFSM